MVEPVFTFILRFFACDWSILAKNFFFVKSGISKITPLHQSCSELKRNTEEGKHHIRESKVGNVKVGDGLHPPGHDDHVHDQHVSDNRHERYCHITNRQQYCDIRGNLTKNQLNNNSAYKREIGWFKGKANEKVEKKHFLINLNILFVYCNTSD